MKRVAQVIFICMSFVFTNVHAQRIATLDVVRADADYEKEAIYFYEQNWREFRIAALKEGFISGFNLLRTPVDSTNHFNFILITEYPDSARFDASEANFRPIMRKIAPGGPRLLNDVKSKTFLESVIALDALSIAAPDE